MTLDSKKDASWMAVASSATALCAVAFGYAYLHRHKRLDAPPVAPGGMLETIDAMGGSRSFAFQEEMARLVGSRIYQLNLPFIGGGGVYVVADNKAAREVLLDATSEKPGIIYHSISKIGGTPNIFTRLTTDPHWKIARKGSVLAFSTREVSRMKRICAEHLERWIKERLEPMIEKGESFDPSYEMTRLTFHIIMESAFEYKCTDDDDKDDFDEFEHHVGIALREFIFRQATNPFRATFGFLIPSVRAAHQSCLFVRAYAKKVLDAYRANTTKSEQNTLIRLVETNKGIPSDAVKVSELVTYIIAGFDTTGYTLANTLVLLAKHPAILNATRNSLVSNPTEPSDYLRHVLAESFRCVPVAANITVRQVGREYTFTRAENNRTIRLAKGSIVFMPQYAANRDPDVYNEPDAFDPERWIHPTSAMKEGLYPFSLGSRNCIGQSLAKAELDSVLPRLLSTYDFELVEEGQLDYFLTLKFSGARLQATRVG